MKTRIRVFLPVAVAVVFVLSGAAYAQSYRSMAPFYIGIFGGYVAPEDMTWRSSVTGERADLALDESGMMGIKFGYVIPQARALAVELEWNYMFDQSIPPQRIGGWTESGDVSLNNFLVNLILRYPEGKIHPYVGAGIGASSVNIRNTESSGGIVYVAEETETGFAWQLLAGVNVELAPNLSADLAYRYFGTKPDFSLVDVEYRTHAVTFGLNFHF
ncbi:MAG TPA: outer membrane beta-barrel protein [Syntrophales bacterium]|nr:outer membrane beta-barrel protein [Syntrophales bacterium]